jgi:hypothetical protein
LPTWLSEPLVVVTYPIRGTHDMDRMEPNEFYPYTAALKHVDRIAEETNSHVLVILMHRKLRPRLLLTLPPFTIECFEAFSKTHNAASQSLYATASRTLKASLTTMAADCPRPSSKRHCYPGRNSAFPKICHGQEAMICPAAPLRSVIASERY